MRSDEDSPPGGRSGFRTVAGHVTTVFLVDDDPEFSEIARHILSERGYEVTSAADGGSALEWLSAMADAHLPLPDVLVLDFVLPKLSGLGVVRALRQLRCCPPTLILTGFVDSSVDTFARSLGALGVLRKPIDPETLCAAVSEAAGLGSAATRAARGL